MKSALTDTVTSNEQLVRLRIYDGVIPIDQGAQDLIDLYKGQAEAAERRLVETLDEIERLRLIVWQPQ